MRSLILLLVFASSASAVDQAAIDAYILRSKLERPEAIAEAKANITNVRHTDTDKVEKRASLKSATDYLKKLQDANTPFYAKADFDLTEPKTGRIGLCDLHLKVIQVVDDNNSIVDYEWTYSIPSGVATDDPRTFARGSASKSYWLANVSTKNFATGEYTDQEGVFALTGTKTYPTSAGPRTIMILEYVDLRGQEEKFMGR
jgi:hypothetical protein